MQTADHCPCCGAESQIAGEIHPTHGLIYVRCMGCGLRTSNYRTVAEAMAAWTKRPGDRPRTRDGDHVLITRLAHDQLMAEHYKIGQYRDDLQALENERDRWRKLAESAMALIELEDGKLMKPIGMVAGNGWEMGDGESK